MAKKDQIDSLDTDLLKLTQKQLLKWISKHAQRTIEAGGKTHTMYDHDDYDPIVEALLKCKGIDQLDEQEAEAREEHIEKLMVIQALQWLGGFASEQGTKPFTLADFTSWVEECVMSPEPLPEDQALQAARELTARCKEMIDGYLDPEVQLITKDSSGHYVFSANALEMFTDSEEEDQSGSPDDEEE